MSRDRKLLYEVFRQSNKANFQKFLDDITDEDGVINTEMLFQYKKDFDEQMKLALKRVNNIGKPIKSESK